MEYRTLWGGVSVALILRFYPERVETKRGSPLKAFGWPCLGHDDAYRPVRVVGVVSRARAGKQGDTYEQGNKISTPHCNTGHSITSSASASNVLGMVMPSALAVVRLITSSNFVGCMTGRSAGFSILFYVQCPPFRSTPRMVCTKCGMIGAGVRPDWSRHTNRPAAFQE